MNQWFRTGFAPNALNLICLPQAGADTGLFMRWAPALGSACKILPAMLPGRGMRFQEIIPETLEEIADELVNVLQTMISGPYAILGSSMGGWLGYELCRRIEARHLPKPSSLIVITSPVPTAVRILPVLDGMSIDEAEKVLLAFNPSLASALEHRELLEFILPMIRADFRLCRRYAPVETVPVSVPILGFAGLADPVVTPSAMAGWRDYTKDRFRLISLPGDHGLIDNPPAGLTTALRKVAEQIVADVPYSAAR